MLISMNDIRRHPDGSIDTGYYVAIGHRERAKAVRAFLDRTSGVRKRRRLAGMRSATDR